MTTMTTVKRTGAISALLLMALPLYALTLRWDASPTSNVTYRLKWGTTPGVYPNAVSVGAATTGMIPTPPNGTTVYVVVTALNAASAESQPSNEAIYPGTPPKAFTITRNP